MNAIKNAVIVAAPLPHNSSSHGSSSHGSSPNTSPSSLRLQLVDEHFQVMEALWMEQLLIAADSFEDAYDGGMRLNHSTLPVLERIQAVLNRCTEAPIRPAPGPLRIK